MLKNLSSLEHKIGDRVYHFICDSSSPLNEVKDALAQMIGYIVQVEAAAKAAADAQKQENTVLEAVEDTKE